MIKIAPSILAADFSSLGDAVAPLQGYGADYLHFDVMDGHFVPNITFGAGMCAALRAHTLLQLDVHLMVDTPSAHIDSFIDSGADIITFHVEAERHIQRQLAHIKKRGVKAGVALCPATSLTTLEYVLEDCDLILLLSVNPGFGGQRFIPAVYEKISALRTMLAERGLNTDIEVDGGVDFTTGKRCVHAGATVLVAGTTIFSAPDQKETIKLLRGGI